MKSIEIIHVMIVSLLVIKLIDYIYNVNKLFLCLSRSTMSSSDQMDSIEYLTKLVSTTLGLREQLDIIRIISPDANVSAADTEFFIGKSTPN
jgi:hypothetical protein